jgi:4-amino-4-deoxy-L-arabinose transferase-like glycosyltransferase
MHSPTKPIPLVISNKSRWLMLILLLALIMRLAVGLSQDHLTPYNESWWFPDHGLGVILPENPIAPYRLSGGDTWWYLDHGLALFDGTVKGPPPSAPLYLLFAGLWQTLLPGADAVMMMRVSQALMGTLTCFFAYRLAAALTDDDRVGLIAAGALAIAPVFIIESAQILTETLYVFLVMGGLAAYVEMVKYPDRTRQRYLRIVLIALLLGLATMTRAVLLLFPLGLAGHLLLVYGWRRGLKYATLLLTIYVLLTSIWTIYNLVRWDTQVVGAQGLSAFFFIGATEWKAPDQIDATLAEGADGQLPSNVGQQQEIYADAAAQAIGADPVGWITRRFTRLAGALLQPHGTAFFPGESLKDSALTWLKQDRTPGGLLRLTQGEQFWPKLAIYLFYYISLLGGLLGLWITRRKWRVALPLSGFILYTLLLHLLLDALPRYLFPLNSVWWVFAAVALVAAWDRLRQVRRLPVALAHQQ